MITKDSISKTKVTLFGKELPNKKDIENKGPTIVAVELFNRVTGERTEYAECEVIETIINPKPIKPCLESEN